MSKGPNYGSGRSKNGKERNRSREISKEKEQGLTIY